MKPIQGTINFINALIEITTEFFTTIMSLITSATSFREIVRWFHNHEQLKFSDRNNIAFTLITESSADNYVVCQGIFNKHEG